MPDWIYAGTKEEIKTRAITKVHTGTHWAALHVFQGKIYAIDDSCPHRGASLAESTPEEDGFVVCWHHNWEFHLQTGQGRHSFMGCVARYAVKEEGEQVFVSKEPLPAPEKAS